MFYIFARFIMFLLFKIFFRLKVFGKEHLPKEGPLIIASNHVSFLDPIAVGVSSSRKLNFIARESLFKSKVFAKVLYGLNTFPIRRDSRDLGVFKLFLNKLSQGKAVLIFPEGTRSKDGSLQKPRYGIGFLQAFSGAAILPCFVRGSADVLPRHSIFPDFKQISVHFGRPLEFDRNLSSGKKEYYMYVAHRVMKAISELKSNAD